METDTLILTCSNFTDSYVQSVKTKLADVLELYKSSGHDIFVSLTILKTLKRLLIISPNTQASVYIYDHLHSHFTMGYSLANSNFTKKDYLKLPEHEKTFLISPPTSPPPEFDFSKVEEGPSVKTLHFDHIKQVLDAIEGSNGKEFVLNVAQGQPVITLDTSYVTDKTDSGLIQGLRTGMPPRSIFEYDD